MSLKQQKPSAISKEKATKLWRIILSNREQRHRWSQCSTIHIPSDSFITGELRSQKLSLLPPLWWLKLGLVQGNLPQSYQESIFKVESVPRQTKVNSTLVSIYEGVKSAFIPRDDVAASLHNFVQINEGHCASAQHCRIMILQRVRQIRWLAFYLQVVLQTTRAALTSASTLPLYS